MLTINFGRWYYSVIGPDALFRNTFKPEWLQDDFVKEMILDIDKSVVESPYCITSPVLGQISTDYLSGGVKALILMLKQDTFPIEFCNCGPNCAKWIAKISTLVDRECTCRTYDLNFEGLDIQFKCKNDGTLITDPDVYIDKCIEFIGKAGEKSERFGEA